MARVQEIGVTSASPPAPEAGCAAKPSLGAVWKQAEIAFAQDDGFGIECGRHAEGFYHATISRRWPDEAFAMLAYETSDVGVAEALQAAITKAKRNLGLGIDFRALDLPKAAAQ